MLIRLVLRWFRRRFAPGLVCSALAFALSCARPCRIDLGETQPELEVVSEAFYCPETPASPQFARVQILADSSGSMNGFKAAVPPLQSWMRQSVSLLLGNFLDLRSFRACYFNQDIGIGGCSQGFTQAQPPFKVGGDTNLHQAILSAADVDLSFIITDGVAFTGGGTGNCAGGVDAACVGRSLIRVLKDYQVEQQGPAGGVWVVPLVAHFAGIFPTEQQVRPEDFHASDVQDKVQQETGQLVEIKKPRLGPGGQLIYDYQGPKVMFLLVIARQVNLGRAAIRALSQQMAMSGVKAVASFTEAKEGPAAFRPVEVFPGTLPQSKWRGANLLYEPGSRQRSRCGAIQHTWDRQSAKVQLECPEGNAELLLSLPLDRQDSPARCVHIGLFAPFRLALEPRDAAQGKRSLLKDFRASWANSQVLLHLQCIDSPQAGQGGGGLETYRWTLRPDIAKAADCLAQPLAAGCPKDTVDLLLQVSSENPAYQPHRAFGLAPTLKFFLNEARTLSSDPAIAEVSFSLGGKP